jgi:hypothetical protein
MIGGGVRCGSQGRAAAATLRAHRIATHAPFIGIPS